MQEVVSENPTKADLRAKAAALIPQAIEIAFPQVATRLMRVKCRSFETGSRVCGFGGLFYTHWPYCVRKLETDGRQNLWLPLGREYAPIGYDPQRDNDNERCPHLSWYEQFGHLAWQFTCDPREIEGGCHVIQGDTIYLYKDGETHRVRGLEDDLRRVGRLIAAGTGENAVVYAGLQLSTLPRK
jgi:hypothetical protein